MGTGSVVGSHSETSLCNRGNTSWSKILSRTHGGSSGTHSSSRSMRAEQVLGDQDKRVRRRRGIHTSQISRSYGSILCGRIIIITTHRHTNLDNVRGSLISGGHSVCGLVLSQQLLPAGKHFSVLLRRVKYIPVLRGIQYLDLYVQATR